ncbi:hypothetical protein DM806_22265 [Sphingobium lactosutens]|uniref:hypothetical protein n=1 Tax=Sphingobium lactosutens TaxID=522773 RepID=UPI0015B9387A|nr:hypothetical protein [Sphingobium lactosutens]NWK98342.1 hypothetical protein [Sphingobium lactosutens]
MIHPSAIEIIRNIEATLVDIVEPAVQTTTARSALATIGHLLRHVALRIEDEGQLLTDDIAALKLLLNDLAVYIASTGDTARAREIGTAMSAAEPPAGRYPSIQILATQAAALRAVMQDILAYLQTQRDARRGEADYLAARAAIRAYLTADVLMEARLIHPAFEDKGPRR